MKKEIPGLEQLRKKITNKRVKEHLEKYGYVIVSGNPSRLLHTESNQTLILCVDVFGIKYTPKEDADHLLIVVQE